MWTLKDLIIHAKQTQTEINGEWVPARPLSAYGFYGFRLRLSAAWKVLRGVADAFMWPSGQ